MSLDQISDADLLASLPRGIRNNNPLNLKTRGTKGHDGDFAVYNTPDEGIAAADRNLQAYHSKHGINTVAGVVNRWAPPNADGNHTSAYTTHVASKLGVDPNAPIDMVNPETRRALIGAMGEFENGVPIAPASPATSPLESVSDAELLASLPKPAPPPGRVRPPQIIGRSANGGVTIEREPRVDQVLGFEKGVTKPVDNLAGGLEYAAGKVGLDRPINALGDFLGLPSRQDATAQHAGYLADQRAKGVVPGKIGEFAGNVAGTAWVPGGPLVQGAVGGGLLSDKHDLKGVAGDVALGGAVGRAAALGSDALQLGARKLLSTAPKIMSIPALKTAYQTAYKAIDNSGFAFPKADVQALVNDFEHTMGSMALSKSAKEDAENIIQYARTKLATGDVSLSQMDKLRSDIYSAMVKKGGDTGALGGAFRTKIDALIDGSNNPAVKQARELYKRWTTADFVNRASKSADRAAEQTYGGDYGRKVKDRLAPLVDELKPTKNIRGASDDVKAGIEKVVRGTKTQNLASTVGGMLDPRRLGGKIAAGITTTGGGAGALATGGLSLLAPALQMGTGLGLTATASGIARKNVDDLIRLIAAGGSKQALAKVPTRASHAAEVLISKARAPLVAASVPALAAARRGPKPTQKK